MQNRKSIGVSL